MYGTSRFWESQLSVNFLFFTALTRAYMITHIEANSKQLYVQTTEY